MLLESRAQLGFGNADKNLLLKRSNLFSSQILSKGLNLGNFKMEKTNAMNVDLTSLKVNKPTNIGGKGGGL